MIAWSIAFGIPPSIASVIATEGDVSGSVTATRGSADGDRRGTVRYRSRGYGCVRCSG